MAGHGCFRYALPQFAKQKITGPKPLRSVDYTYGLPKGILTPRQVEQVRLGTYCAFQSANFLREAHGRGVGFAIETPEPRQGVVSVFTLPELVALSNSE